jgi:hypothetical protein
MTLMKSLLLGSAAGIVAVSAAQAADLPTRKGPVAAEYVRVCSITVAGTPVVGFVLPGSDTCLKISGYIDGEIEGGNLKSANAVTYVTPTSTVAAPPAGAAAGLTVVNPATGLPVAALPAPATAPPTAGTVINRTTYQSVASATTRDDFGYTTRFNLTFDAVSNTAYGPLVAHGEYQFNHGGGYDNSNGASDGGLNRAYVTWAGLTAGKIDSFFSFTGGGLAWNNFFSPDRKGFDQPDVLAYTASFGGGFSATVSIEDPYNGGANGLLSNGTTAISASHNAGNGTYAGYLGSATENGLRVPDIVGALDVKQAWGAAHIGGVGHNIRATSADGDGVSLDKWGYAIDAGLSFNIPNLPGSVIGVTGAWTRNATIYSGLLDAEAGEAGNQVNGNGQPDSLADAFYNGDGTWATPTAWTVSAWANFTLNPQVTVGVEGSYGEINWTGLTLPSPVSNSKSYLVGFDAHYDPVKNLDFQFELLYESTKTAQPTGYLPNANPGFTTTWQSKSDGFESRLQITRNF